jgi:hypothetical protein
LIGMSAAPFACGGGEDASVALGCAFDLGIWPVIPMLERANPDGIRISVQKCD